MITKKTICIYAAALLCSFGARAEEPDIVYADSVPQMQLEEQMLEEVTVSGQKPLIQTSADKVTYNMDEDPSAQTATVADAMRKVPMITVDAEGNIKLKGESNFKIYMNGKADPALSSNYKDILKAMPASSIKKIEVITEPGAKYDAEGVGGIINIVTDSKSKLEGWSATLTASGTRHNVSGGINALAKFKRVSLNLNYNHSYNMQGQLSQNTHITYLNDPLNHLYQIKTNTDLNSNFDYGGLQAAWEPDSTNLFTLNADLFNYNTPFDALINYNMFDAAGSKRWSYRSDSHFKNKYLSYTAGANWQHNFSSPEHNIVILYQYSHDTSRETRRYIYKDYENYDTSIPGLLEESDYPDNEHTFQADYTHPFSDKHTLETGAKYIMRRNYGDSFQSQSYDGVQWILNEKESVRMKQHQDIASVYAAYTGKYGQWVVKGGVRYESTHMSSKFRTPGYTDYSQNLNDVVPNAMIAYTLPDYSSLRLSYQMRITRPGLEDLNPYRNEHTPNVISYGNPELVSQKANNLNLTYSNFSLPVQMNLTLSYNYTDKMILDYSFLGKDGISYTTKGNLGHCNQGSLFAYLAYPVIPGMRLSFNGSVNYKDYKSRQVDVHTHGWGWSAGGDLNYEMPWDLELNAYGGAGQGGVTFQGKMSTWSYHGLGITKSLLKEKRLRITLTASNFFTPNYKYNNYKYTPDMTQVSTSKISSWNIGLSVSMRLGSYNQSIKTTAKSIENDDLNQSSGNAQGSGIGGNR